MPFAKAIIPSRSQRTPNALLSLVLGILVASGLSSRTSAQELTVDRVLDTDRVIEISIDLPADDWNVLRKQTRDIGKVFSGVTENPFTYFKGDITIDGVITRSVGIRKKGFIGSLDDRFPSLKVNFDEFVKQTPVKGLEGLTLNNNKQDSTLASQFLAYRLFNSAGVQAPRCNFARVTVNGEYLGVYSNVESIDKPFLKRRFNNNSGNLYEGTLADFYPKSIERLEVKTNKKNHDRSKVARLAELLAADNELPIDKVEELVDIDNFLRFWAMESLIGFWDGYSNNQNNYWIYENRSNGKFYFMPWGADGAFMTGGFPGFGPRGPASVYAESMLANRLYHDEKTAQRYRETMRSVLVEVWKEDEILKSVDQIETLVKPHLHGRQAGAPRAMNSLRTFVRTRRAAIEKELNAWPVRVAAQPRKPQYSVNVGSAHGSFSTKWSETPPGNVSKTGSVSIEVELDGKPVEFRQIGASAHRPRQGGFPFGFGGPTPQAAPPMANVVITGMRTPGDKLLTVTLSLDPQVLAENIGQPVEVQGSLSGDTGGASFVPFGGGRVVAGSVTFTKANLKAGEVVEGQFDLTISEMKGGFMDRRGQGQGPPGPGPGGPPMFGPGGPGSMQATTVALIGFREVQDELSLTDAQRKQIQDTLKGLEEQVRSTMTGMREIFELPEEERPERMQAARLKMEEANRKAEEQVHTQLNSKQRDRLKQLKLQREGVSAFTRAEVIEKLTLSDQQRERITAIRQAGQPEGPFAFPPPPEEQRKQLQDAVAVLTAEQKDKWESLIGKEFRFPTPPNPFGGPGPNGGPPNPGRVP